MVTVKSAGLLSLKEASVRFKVPVKRLRRWVRYHRFGAPVRDEAGHFLVDPAKVEKYVELASRVADLRAMLDGEAEELAKEPDEK